MKIQIGQQAYRLYLVYSFRNMYIVCYIHVFGRELIGG